jgi:hypothetical protein
MEKENKYYIPEISEFYIGFEYNGWIQDQGPYIFSINDSLKEIQEGINLMAITVKYLDKEDIESLGFEFIKVNEYIFSGDGSSEIYRIYHSSNKAQWYELLMFENYNKVWVDLVHTQAGVKMSFFKGTIKNKSELKKLMKQLNII